MEWGYSGDGMKWNGMVGFGSEWNGTEWNEREWNGGMGAIIPEIAKQKCVAE